MECDNTMHKETGRDSHSVIKCTFLFRAAHINTLTKAVLHTHTH